MRRYLFGWGLAVLGAAPIVTASEAPLIDALQRPALRVSQPAQAVLIDIARAGRRLVAAGEQGVILLSDDDGKHWRQVTVPVSVSLTALSFPNERQGWAVGHSGVVLHTADAGESWSVQLDGQAAAQRVLEALPVDAGTDPAQARQLRIAQSLVAEGADKPWLAVHFSNARQGTVVGAFGLIMHTEDGGQSWQSWMDRLDNPRGYHLYALAGHGKRLYIAGEQGLLLVSDDQGQHFRRLPSPYPGSFFALNLSSDGTLVLAGLRGQAWRSDDGGMQWQALANPFNSSLMAARWAGIGQVMLADQSGRLLLSSELAGLREQASSAAMPVASLTLAADGHWVVVGSRGVKRLDAGARP